MQVNKVLAVVALALFALSAFAYHDSQQRAERFERGQKFLPHLNPDEIAEVTIKKGEEETNLRRDGDHFVVVDANGYPAKNESVNRFINDVLKIELEKEIGRGAKLVGELGLEESFPAMIEVAFKDSNQKDMVRFRVGNTAPEDSGHYVHRIDSADDPIYLTGSRLYFTTESDQFLDKEILDITQEKIARIVGADYVIERVEGTLEMQDVPPGKKATSGSMSKARTLSAGLRFDKHYLADAAEVAGLQFSDAVDVELEDGSGYRFELAEKGEIAYLRVEAFHNTEQVQISMEASEEEVRETSEILARADELQDFNNLHGSWIYEINQATAEKIKARQRDLLEDA